MHFFGEAEKKPSVEGAGEDFCGTKKQQKTGTALECIFWRSGKMHSVKKRGEDFCGT